MIFSGFLPYVLVAIVEIINCLLCFKLLLYCKKINAHLTERFSIMYQTVTNNWFYNSAYIRSFYHFWVSRQFTLGCFYYFFALGCFYYFDNFEIGHKTIAQNWFEVQFLLKGALDNFRLIPRFKKKVEIFILLEVYNYVMTACLILLATSTLLQRYVNFSCSGHFKKSTLKNGRHCNDCWIWHHPP